MKKKCIIITGPTGVGKTSLSIELAKLLNGEIISADSMQIYKHLDIGTAKIKPEEMQGIKHHIIDFLEPDTEFSVAEFQDLCLEKIDNIIDSGKIPIIVGGTGLYLDSIIFDMDFDNTQKNIKRRRELELLLEKEGIDSLLNIIKEYDENILEFIDSKNPRRIIRAIEIVESGNTKSNFKTELKKRKGYDFIHIVLIREREHLYKIINDRVDKMIEDGLVEEVKRIVKSKKVNSDSQSMKAIGYRQIISALNNDITIEEAIELIKRDSRRYAKRQLTWFKKYSEAKFIDVEKVDKQEIINHVKSLLIN